MPGDRARPAAKAQALSDRNATLLASLVGELPYDRRPTWNCIAKLARGQFRHAWTRQWLSHNSIVRAAYDAKLAQYRAFQRTGKAPIVRTPEEEAQRQRIARLERELADLKNAMAEYDRRLVLYIANAVRFGLSLEQMEAPLIPVDHGQTDALPIAGSYPR